MTPCFMSRDLYIPTTAVARRCSTEGEARHGHAGDGRFGGVQGQLQPKIRQDEDETLVR